MIRSMGLMSTSMFRYLLHNAVVNQVLLVREEVSGAFLRARQTHVNSHAHFLG